MKVKSILVCMLMLPLIVQANDGQYNLPRLAADIYHYTSIPTIYALTMLAKAGWSTTKCLAKGSWWTTKTAAQGTWNTGKFIYDNPFAAGMVIPTNIFIAYMLYQSGQKQYYESKRDLREFIRQLNERQVIHQFDW